MIHFAIGLKVFMEGKKEIVVQVSYITPQTQFLRSFSVARGSTVEAAIQVSGVLQTFPEIILATVKTGIYSKRRPLETELQDKDRIEIYRPLLIEPMAARRKRANKNT